MGVVLAFLVGGLIGFACGWLARKNNKDGINL